MNKYDKYEFFISKGIRGRTNGDEKREESLSMLIDTMLEMRDKSNPNATSLNTNIKDEDGIYEVIIKFDDKDHKVYVGFPSEMKEE